VCGNIKLLYNLDPPATDEEIRASALQFVRKISGLNKPSAANEAAFGRAVDDVAAVSQRLLDALTTAAPPRKREREPEEHRAYFEAPPTFGSGE
jgi:hypothetical protein